MKHRNLVAAWFDRGINPFPVGSQVSALAGTWTGSYSERATLDGRAASFDGGRFDDSVLTDSYTECSWLLVFTPDAVGTSNRHLWTHNDSASTDGFHSVRIESTGPLYWYARQSAYVNVNSVSSLTANTRYVAVGLFKKNDSMRLFLDGAEVGTPPTPTSDFNAPNDTYRMGEARTGAGGGLVYDGTIGLFALFDTLLADGDMPAIAADPFGFTFGPTKPLIYDVRGTRRWVER